MTDRVIYTKRDLKRMFDVSDRTLRRWIAAGKFPAPMMPGRWDRVVVDQWRADKCGHFRPSSDQRPEIRLLDAEGL